MKKNNEKLLKHEKKLEIFLRMVVLIFFSFTNSIIVFSGSTVLGVFYF